MKLQFLLCSNPNKPEQGELVYHAKSPRFLAEIGADGHLEIIDFIDDAPFKKYIPKIKRAEKWLISIQNKRHA